MVLEATEEYDLAQITAFQFVSDVRQHALSFAPDVAWLTHPITVTVNFSNSEYPACNAWFDGDSDLPACRNSGYGYSCNNTGMLADVVYHEFGTASITSVSSRA